jgi:hypothetical protein
MMGDVHGCRGTGGDAYPLAQRVHERADRLKCSPVDPRRKLFAQVLTQVFPVKPQLFQPPVQVTVLALGPLQWGHSRITCDFLERLRAPPSPLLKLLAGQAPRLDPEELASGHEVADAIGRGQAINAIRIWRDHYAALKRSA